MLLGQFTFESIKNKLKEIKEAKGIEAVKSWCSDFGIDNKYCNTCETKTPSLHSMYNYECAICGNKGKQENG